MAKSKSESFSNEKGAEQTLSSAHSAGYNPAVSTGKDFNLLMSATLSTDPVNEPYSPGLVLGVTRTKPASELPLRRRGSLVKVRLSWKRITSTCRE